MEAQRKYADKIKMIMSISLYDVCHADQIILLN